MKLYALVVPILLIALVSGITIYGISRKEIMNKKMDKKTESESNSSINIENAQTATFAGGCFWCIESALQETKGVIDAVNGYAGGLKENADYKKVAKGKTKHREAVQVAFDPKVISYEQLLQKFLQQIDPTDAGGQFSDRGFQYTTAIYYHDEQQKAVAEKSLENLEKSDKFEKEIATKILEYSSFYKAEEYHQDYYKKAADHYIRYKKGSGREDFIEENWAREAALEAAEEDEAKKDGNQGLDQTYNYTDEEIKEKLENLDPLSYHVVVEEGTETPFDNEYWDNKAEGIYVDKVTGKPLFSSTHKYDSGTGWPTFYKTIDEDAVSFEQDNSLFTPRTEVRSEGGHLGHVFDDGPKEQGGQRFCMNSASLLFIPKSDMVAEGYGNYLYLFE